MSEKYKFTDLPLTGRFDVQIGRESCSRIDYQFIPRENAPVRRVKDLPPGKYFVTCDYAKIERKMAMTYLYGDIEIELMRDGTLKTRVTPPGNFF